MLEMPERDVAREARALAVMLRGMTPLSAAANMLDRLVAALEAARNPPVDLFVLSVTDVEALMVLYASLDKTISSRMFSPTDGGPDDDLRRAGAILSEMYGWNRAHFSL